MPEKVKKFANQEEYQKCQKYSRAKIQFGMVKEYIETLVTLLIWSLNWPSLFWDKTLPWSEGLEWAKDSKLNLDVVQGLLLMLFFIGLDLVIKIPFSLLDTFLIAEQHGFNKQTLRLWIRDKIVGLLLTFIFYPILVYSILAIIDWGGEMFPIYAGIFLTVFILILLVILPIFVMPLFNRFEPIEENKLKDDVEQLAVACDYPLSKIEVVDGSKRSSHSNAFQYGFGKIKKIVIFDTLIEQYLGKLKKDGEEEENKEEDAEKKAMA